MQPDRSLITLISIIACALLAIFLFDFTAGISLPQVDQQTMQEIDPNADQDLAELVESSTTIQQGLSSGVCGVSRRFPQSILKWCEPITRYAMKHGLPPDLVAALIWQESGGDPIAYSRSGAVGLMQVMPRDGLASTFMCVNGPCFSNRPTAKELKDPEFNIAYGTKMLAGLFNRYGNLRDALKSYGPMNVGYYYADKVMGLFQRYGESAQ